MCKQGMIVWMTIVSLLGWASANEWRVDKDGGSNFATIQEAIDGAADGDVIWVGDGTWSGDGNRDIDFRGKAITVRSKNGPERCIIDCQGKPVWGQFHRGFVFQSEEPRDAILEGFTITHGMHSTGAGILCTNGSNPTIRGNIIEGNFIPDDWDGGGGIACRNGAAPLIVGNLIGDNVCEPGGGGGGIICYDSGRVEIAGNVIVNNSSSHGGGIEIGYFGSALVENNLIAGNHASSAGGVGFWGADGELNLRNNTIAYNQVEYNGAGVLIGHADDASVVNCIVWGNRSLEGFDEQIVVENGSAYIRYCCIENWGKGGDGNIHVDPLFVDADGADNAMGTGDDDLRLIGGSPCLDAGYNLAVPDWMTRDVAGEPRIQNGIVDIGAYEGPHQGLVVGPKEMTVAEGQTASFTIRLGTDPGGEVEVEVHLATGDGNITITSPKILHFDSSNFDQPQTVSLAAGEDSDCISGSTVFIVRATEFVSVQVRAVEIDNDFVLHVDSNQTGGGGGADWANAFATLQEALSVARNVPGIREIRVAQGTYWPTYPFGWTPDNRIATFELVNGIAYKGGYAGNTLPNPDERDIEKYKTILSGDLLGNDGSGLAEIDWLTDPIRSDNCYHVVTANHVNSETIFEGFTIRSGNANGDSIFGAEYRGGGYFGVGSHVKIRQCRFENNSAIWGGGLSLLGGAPVVDDCVFVNNAAQNHGGALESEGSNVLRPVRDCRFVGNVAGMVGGAVWNFDDNPEYRNCIFDGNRATEGGGAVSQVDGGGYRFVQCTFVGNRAEGSGGAINSSEWPYLSNCIFWDNQDQTGSGELAHVFHWGESLPFYYCCVQGWTGTQSGPGNFGDEPQFARNGYWGAMGGWSFFHDYWVPGDYHLMSQGGRWDAAAKAWVQDAVTSPCIDVGDPASLIMYEPFPNGGVINMGAYGGTAEASKSWFGKPVCTAIAAGDINGDCKVDLGDFAIMAGNWLWED